MIHHWDLLRRIGELLEKDSGPDILTGAEYAELDRLMEELNDLFDKVTWVDRLRRE